MDLQKMWKISSDARKVADSRLANRYEFALLKCDDLGELADGLNYAANEIDRLRATAAVMRAEIERLKDPRAAAADDASILMIEAAS